MGIDATKCWNRIGLYSSVSPVEKLTARNQLYDVTMGTERRIGRIVGLVVEQANLDLQIMGFVSRVEAASILFKTVNIVKGCGQVIECEMGRS